MARIHGRLGQLYLGLASSTAAAEAVAFLSKWQITFDTDDAEVTAFGDSNKTYVSGLPHVVGPFVGYSDAASVQTYTAAPAGQPRRFYLYPGTPTNTGQ